MATHGNTVLVQLDKPRGTKVAVTRSEVRSLDLPVTPTEVSIQPITSPSKISPPYEASRKPGVRQAVEALRFGLVPEFFLSEITIGFDQIATWVESHLPRPQHPTFSEIRGAFGTGKTHLLSIVRHIARKKNFMTAHVEVDGKRVSFSDPYQLLSAIWRSLVTGDRRSATPLVDLYVSALKKGHDSVSIAPRGTDRISRAYQAVRALMRCDRLDLYGPAVDAVISCDNTARASEVMTQIRAELRATGCDATLLPLIGRYIEDRPYDFIESLIGHTVVGNLAGYAGLVLTIDEFEVERLDQTRITRVEALLQVLIRYFKGGLDHPAAPIAIFVATVGENTEGTDSLLDSVLAAVGGDAYDVPRLTAAGTTNLANRIATLYGSAFEGTEPIPLSFATSVIDGLTPADISESGFTRAFIKAAVSQLDARYGPCGP